MSNRIHRLGLCALLAITFSTAAVTGAAAQIHACYVQNTGVIYRIDPDGTLEGNLPTACRTPDRHIQFSWVDGAGAVRSGDAAGGDLGGTYPNPTVAGLQGKAVSSAAPTTDGQVLAWDDGASEWTPTSVNGAASPWAGLQHLRGVTVINEVNPSRHAVFGATANCPSGYLVINGGFKKDFYSEEYATIKQNAPVDSDTWRVEAEFVNRTDDPREAWLTAYAICAPINP